MIKIDLHDGIYQFTCPGGGPKKDGRFTNLPICPSSICGDWPRLRIRKGEIIEINCDQVVGEEDRAVARIIAGPHQSPSIRCYDPDEIRSIKAIQYRNLYDN
jgi:hypothetical protein